MVPSPVANPAAHRATEHFHDDEGDAHLYAVSLPPPLVRVGALGPVVLGVLLAYFAFLLRGAMGGPHTTLVNVYFVWTFLLGAAHLLVAPSIAKARVWAVFAGGALSVLGTVSSAVLLKTGAFAGAFGVAVGLASVVVLAIALPGCLRVGRARRDLAARHPEELFAGRDRRTDLLGVLVALAILGVFSGFFAWRTRTASTPAQKFAATAFGQALDEPLTRYVAAMSQEKPSLHAAEARDDLLSKDIQKQLGAEGFQRLRAVLDTAHAYAVEPGDDSAAQKSFWTALNGLDAQLESRGVPGFVGGYSTGGGDSRAVWVLGYFARARASVRVGDAAPMRVVWAKRLDSLNLTDSAASLDGLSEWAVVSLDALEEEFLVNELPAIAQNAPMHLVEGEAAEQGAAADVGRRAAALIGDEIVRGSRLSREDAKAIDVLLAQRAANEQVLDEKGLTLRSRQRLRFTPAAARSLRRYDDFVITQLLKGDDELADYEDAVASAVDLLAADEEASFLPRVAPQGQPGDDRTRHIMGGQLMAIAQSSKTPRLTLWRAAQQAVRGTYGRRAGWEVFDAFFRELGIADALDGSGDAFATGLLRALEKDPAEVRAAARRAYADLLGQEPPVVVRTMLR